jgi:hypothetical protein
MKNLSMLAVVVALICIILGLISRYTMKPLALAPGGLEANALFVFANTCLLMAITMMLMGSCKDKK